MDTPEPTVSYWPRRTLLVVMLTGSLLPAAACIWLIDAGLFAGRLLGTNVDLTGPRAIRLLGMVPFICIMLYFAALCAYRLWRPQPSLTLKTDGMEIRPFFGSARFVGWEDVTEITIFDYRQNFGKRIEGIGVGLRDPDRYMQGLSGLNRLDARSNARKFGYHLYVGRAMLTVPLENARETMQRFLDRSRQPEAPSAQGRTNR